MKYVEGISGSSCIIAGETIPISRMKKKEFMEQLMRHMGEA